MSVRNLISTLVLATGLLVVSTAPAAERSLSKEPPASTHEILSEDANGVPTFVRGALGLLDPAGQRAVEGEAFLQAYSQEMLGATGIESYQLRKEVQDAEGLVHLRYDQRLHGLRAVGAQLIVHADAVTGEVYAVNGHFASSGDQSANAKLMATDALGRALEKAGLSGGELQGTPELVYVHTTSNSWRLAWRGRYLFTSGTEAEGTQSLDDIFADASSGALLAIHPLFHDVKSWQTYRSFRESADDFPDPFGPWLLPGQLLCTDDQSCSDAIAQATHDNVSTSYDYYYQVHGRDSYDNAGATIRFSVGFGFDPFAAFWRPDLQQVVFGDGDSPVHTLWNPFGLALDIVAHELTHAVTENESALIYFGESGALNESLSDIFAASIEAWDEGGNPTIYLLAEDVFTPPISGDALRYMSDPELDRFNFLADPESENYSRDFYPDRFQGAGDNGGVHFNSGISNLAFYLLAEGGSHPRGKSAVQVPALSMTTAARIFYRAQTTYLAPSSTFEDARFATAQAAEDLFGTGSPQVEAVHDAWCAVGVPGCATDAEPPTVSFQASCTGLTCAFTTAQTGGTSTVTGFTWTFPGGATASGANPSFFFPGYGTYSVTVDVVDAAGQAGSSTDTVTVTPPTGTIDPKIGNWYNPQRNGNGIDVWRTSDGRYGLAWYTYEVDGTPIWYQSDVVAKTAVSWQATLKQATWDGTSATLTAVGSVRLDLSNPNEAWFSWTLNGESGGERLEFLFGGGGRDGAWYAPSEPGWGIEVAEQSGTLGAAVTFYEGGQPRWVSGSAAAGSDVTVPLSWRTGTGLCPSCTGGGTTPPASVPAGSVQLQIAGSASTTGTATTSVITPSGATWNRGPVAIQLLTAP